MQEGWNKVNSKWYYVRNGQLYKGWHQMSTVEGESIPHWSFFHLVTGELYTGWHYMASKEGEKSPHYSYFGDNGWLRTGWVRMGKGTANPDANSEPHWSYFGSNGWLRTGWVRFGRGTSEPDGNSEPHWSYFGKNGWLQTGWKYFTQSDGEKASHWSYFGKNGWMRTGMAYLSASDDESVPHYSYFGNNGWLLQNGSVVINNKSYKADNRGWLTYDGWTYSKFVSTYRGKGIDYDGAYSVQCVDLIKFYLDRLWGIKPGTWGHAFAYYDGFYNHKELIDNFDRIANTSTFVPKRGDIVVWKKALNGAYGHIAIATGEGDTDFFYSWDQNWTGNNDPMAKILHRYDYVAGVLRPKDQSLMI